MKYILSIIFIPLFSTVLFSQSDTIKIDEIKNEKKIKFLLSFDNRNSSVLDEPVKFNGLKIGLEYKNVHDFGLGFYSTQNAIRKQAKEQGLDVQATMNYTTIFYQYTFLQNRKWELALPVHFGSGRANLLFIDSRTDSVIILKNGEKREDEIKYPIAELGFEAQYKVFRWFGFGSGIGYRFTFSNDKNVKNLLNAPVFSFKIKIFLGELYRAIKEEVKKEK